jgi:DNA-binding beta-propeller fold protein YncE
MSDATNVWAICNYREQVSATTATSNAFLSKMDLKGNVITDFPLYSNTQIFNVLPLGTNIWVTDSTHNQVLLVDPDNGSIQTAPVGSDPKGMAFDGTNVWVCNYGSASCTVLNQGDGSFVATVNTGRGPMCALFDSEYIWISCYDGHIYIYDPSNLSLVNTLGSGGKIFRMTCLNGLVYALVLDQSSSAPKSDGEEGIAFFLLQMNKNSIQNTVSLIQLAGRTDVYVDIASDNKSLFLVTVGANILQIDPTTLKKINEFGISNMVASYLNIFYGNVFVLDDESNYITINNIDGESILSQSSIIVKTT